MNIRWGTRNLGFFFCISIFFSFDRTRDRKKGIYLFPFRCRGSVFSCFFLTFFYFFVLFSSLISFSSYYLFFFYSGRYIWVFFFLKFLFFFSSLTHLYLSSPFDKNGDFLKIENSVLSGAKLDGCLAALFFLPALSFF
ncbi:hypothetical protein FPQ18DRAFT_171 [Pyronema domesticum]|nr:hypothetical protein FPQ18DRAFT_171 [Pyronema domesticum]